MTPLCTLIAGILLAAQPPIPSHPGVPTPGAPPARVAMPKPPGFRAAGVDATVGAMRLEQKQAARRVAEMATARRNNGGLSTDADLHTAIADFERSAEIEKSLASSDGERVEAILSHVALLFDWEKYFQARMSSGIVKEADYLHVRFHRLGVQSRLLEEVKADPAVIRRHREIQAAVGKSRDELFAMLLKGGVVMEEEMLLRAESVSSEAISAATRAATPAERDAANRKAVESLKDTEKYFAQRNRIGGMATECRLHLVTYLRLDAELRELNAAEKPQADRVRQLAEQRRDAIRRASKLMAERRVGGLFGQQNTDQYRTARDYLVEAELALAADAEARRVLLKHNLKEAMDDEEYFAKLVAGGLVHQSQCDRSICERIEAEIRLKLAK